MRSLAGGKVKIYTDYRQLDWIAKVSKSYLSPHGRIVCLSTGHRAILYGRKHAPKVCVPDGDGNTCGVQRVVGRRQESISAGRRLRWPQDKICNVFFKSFLVCGSGVGFSFSGLRYPYYDPLGADFRIQIHIASLTWTCWQYCNPNYYAKFHCSCGAILCCANNIFFVDLPWRAR